jgi:hypothetical protein
MKQFVPTKQQDFETFDMGKSDGLILWPILPNSPDKSIGKTMEAYINGFISGTYDRVASKNLPHVFLYQSARSIVGDFHGNWFPVISETESKYYVLVSIYTEIKAFWVDKVCCELEPVITKF